MKTFQEILEEEMQQLRDKPEMILEAWRDGGKEDTPNKKEWRLFSLMCPDGTLKRSTEPNPHMCGCLTQIRRDVDRIAFDHNDQEFHEITAIIRADERIPKLNFDIELRDLPIFQKYQLAFHNYYEGHKDKERLIKEISKI